MKTVESCGCVFCDLDLKPVKDEASGKLIHVVMVARRKEIVPCKRNAELT